MAEEQFLNTIEFLCSNLGIEPPLEDFDPLDPNFLIACLTKLFPDSR